MEEDQCYIACSGTRVVSWDVFVDNDVQLIVGGSSALRMTSRMDSWEYKRFDNELVPAHDRMRRKRVSVLDSGRQWMTPRRSGRVIPEIPRDDKS